MTVSYQMGIAEITVPFLGWGDPFLDYDNDGWEELMMSDGHVYPQVDQQPWGTSWAQRPMLFHNMKKFEAVPASRFRAGRRDHWPRNGGAICSTTASWTW